MNDKDKTLAEQDAQLFGMGFLVDGKHVDARRVDLNVYGHLRRPAKAKPRGDLLSAVMTGDLSGVTMEGVPILELSEQRRRLVETLRPFADAAFVSDHGVKGAYINTATLVAARELLSELGEWPEKK